MKKGVIAAVVVAILGIGSCRVLLPERFAVNAPMTAMLFGLTAKLPPPVELRERLTVPDGFSISVYADSIPATARALRFTSSGDLLVSTPRSGGIVLVERDADGNGQSDGMRELMSGLNRPHGIELRAGWLYVAETDAIGRIRFDAGRGAVVGDYEQILTDLPGGGNHWTKNARFGPDGWLYFHVGSSCNVCIEEDTRRGTIMRVRPDGSGAEIVGRGLRNSVGFDWHPATGELYATENGRDLLGDDFPPCELNRIVPGGFYGWPIANGDRVPDPDFGAGQQQQIAASLPPVHDFRAHNAPLGLTFVRGTRLPDAYRNAALVALHGSWNRREKDGYKVVSLHWQPDGSIAERDFATGFERDEDVIGRPVDVAEGPDGAIYVSDDYAGVIWRIAYRDETTAKAPALPARVPRDPLAGLSAQEVSQLSARGQSLYEQHACSSCHDQAPAAAGTAASPLERLAERYSVNSLAQLLATPPAAMPEFPLDPAQCRELAVYLLDSHR
jgi:glucose/arabinose dehydrogenase